MVDHRPVLVDAGKSTISGNILFLTGQVDKRTMEKYEKEAKENNRGTWFYAYIMDTIEEERAKGKTVEVGRAHFETKKKVSDRLRSLSLTGPTFHTTALHHPGRSGSQELCAQHDRRCGAGRHWHPGHLGQDR